MFFIVFRSFRHIVILFDAFINKNYHATCLKIFRLLHNDQDNDNHETKTCIGMAMHSVDGVIDGLNTGIAQAQ